MRRKREAAEVLALDALGWMVADETLLPQFLDGVGHVGGRLARPRGRTRTCCWQCWIF